MDKENLKILIVSNNCLSSTNSNGRTILNLVSNLKNEQVANFYLKEEIPDCDNFTNFYRVSDQDALRAFKSFKKIKVGNKISPQFQNIEVGQNSSKVSNSNFKNPLGSLAREMVWNSKRWISSEFVNWIKDFSPNVILLQAGDAPFLFKLARRIARKMKIPLIIHNCEDYGFKKFNYMSKKHNWLYPFFHHRLARQMKKAIKYSDHCIYNSKELLDLYQTEIKHSASVIMNAGAFDISEGKKPEKFERVVYLGNLGLGREKSILEVGQVLSQYGLELWIYGPFDSKIDEILKDAPGVNYKEMVSYERVKEIILSSDLLIHIESFEEYALKDLKYALSSKIGDYLSSGVPFFAYSPKGMTSTNYLLEFIPDFVATCKVEALFKLKEILTGEIKYSYEEKVRPVVVAHHLLKNNQEVFDNLLLTSIKGELNGK